MSQTSSNSKMPGSAYVQAPVFFILTAVALFASAGTFAIAAFWIYLAIFAAVLLASFRWIDPDLARERMRPGGQKPPLALWLFSGVLFLHWIIAGLDRGRLHVSDTVPVWLQGLGLVALAGGYALCFWAMRVNRFFSSVVRIQTDRGHVLITGGPYAYIRHPGYLSGIAIIVASGLLACDRRAGRLHAAVSAVPRHHRRPRIARRAAGLSGLRRAGPLAHRAGPVVMGVKAGQGRPVHCRSNR
jgi:protein-S-isoprenylcysteine O-methyltransferase Ste14